MTNKPELDLSMGISKTVDIRASPDALYRAVSTSDGFRGWWCKEITVEDGHDSPLLLHFPKSDHLARIRLAKGEAPSRAEWDVLDHNAMPEWTGTKLIFTIEKMGSGSSRLRFQHAGLNQGCECYGPCDNAWGFLMGSMKSYLETGKGTPA